MNTESSPSLGVLPSIREVFLSTGDAVLVAISADEVGEAWEKPSVLAELPVGSLAAHLARAVTQVETYRDGEPPAPGKEPASAGQYFARVFADSDPTDLSSKVNAGVRERARESAAKGQSAIVEEVGASLDRLHERLVAEPADRTLAVYGGVAMRLDQYLLTRLVEMTVHIDDLALSVGMPLPAVPPDAYVIAIGTLVQAASVRHGSLGVLRALARRERDPLDVLRVL